MRWFENWRRGRAVRSYARRLPRLLMKDYGASETYSPAQIRASIRRHGLSEEFEVQAVAIFSDRERFEQVRAEYGELRSYDELRGDVAFRYFGAADTNLAAMDFFSDSGFAVGGASGHESGDFGGHHGQ